MRRAWIAALVLAGCYDPQFREDLDCSESGRCPDGQMCIAGTCTRDGDAIDAAPPTADAPDGTTFTLTVQLVGNGVGSVVSDPPGIDCPTQCSAMFADGVQVTLTPEPAGPPAFQGFEGDCTGNTCVVVMDRARSVQARFEMGEPPNFVFVTANQFTGDLNGLTGADLQCQNEADAAGLPGTFVAWLSDSAIDASDRLASARGWVRPDGKPFVETVADLVAGRILFPARLDAAGNDVGAGYFVWTNTTPDGVLATVHSACQSWTSAAAADFALVGRADSTFAGYTHDGELACTQQAALLCFGIVHDAPIMTPPVGTGPIAFVTSGLFTPSSGADGGLSGADSMCANEANAAGLAGNFLAALATTDTTAASRFPITSGDPPWVRVDGIPLTTEPEQMFDGSLWQISPNLTADGDAVPDAIWFGATTATSIGTSTCTDWQSTSGSGRLGNPSSSDSKQVFGSGQSGACASGHRLLCLEQP